MKTLLPLCLLLCAASGCKKDKADPAPPSKTDNLTAVTWVKNSDNLVVNGVTGTRPVAAANADVYVFGRDGRVTITAPGGTPATGTWAFANNETQLVITQTGRPASTGEIFALNSNSLSLGFRFTQAQIQQALSGTTPPGVPAGLVPLLILSASGYTFPAGTATVPANQITSLEQRTNLVPR